MAVADELKRRWAWVTALRGLLMLLAGIFAVIWPTQALTILVVAGGALLLVDGILGLWSLTFGGAKTGNFWFDVVHNVCAIVLGALILVSPLVATLITVTFLIYLAAFQAIIVGVMEVWVVLRERAQYARIWPVLLSGVLYVLFGVALLFWPLLGATILTIWVGLFMIVFAFGLFGWAWKLYQESKSTPTAAEAS